jgi:hypothetical protein
MSAIAIIETTQADHFGRKKKASIPIFGTTYISKQPIGPK